MLLKSPAANYLYYYGLRAGVPFGALRAVAGAVEMTVRPIETARRRRMARALLKDSPWRGFIPRRPGSRQVGPGEVPGLARLAEIGQQIYERRAQSEREADERRAREKQGKSPITHLLTPEDLGTNSEILQIATSKPLVEIVADYLGTIPRLDYIDLWLSRPNVDNVGSQLYHLDKPGRDYVVIFINVTPVDDSNGPFMFLPADVSRRVCRDLSYEHLYFHGDGRLPDKDLFARVSRADILKLTGAPGSAGFINTSECLHCGSRVDSGERVVMALAYMPAHKIGAARFAGLADRRSSSDSLTPFVLTTSPRLI